MHDTSTAPLRLGLTRFFGLLLVRPVWPAVGLVVLTVFAIWQATQIRVAVDLSGLIGSHTAGAQAMRAYEERFEPIRAEEVLLVHAASFANEDTLAAFEDLVLELQFIEGVEQVISLAAIPAPGRGGAWLSGPELADLPPDVRLHRMRTQNPLAAQLISADLSYAVVVVIPRAGAGGDDLAAEILDAARAVPVLGVQAVGLSAVQRAIAAELIHDLKLLTPGAVGLCLVFALFLFRSWRAVTVIALPSIVGLVWFMGWMGLTGTAVDPVMGALPVLLVVLAFSDSLHMYHAAVHAVNDGGDWRHAIARAHAETTPAVALTTVTTMIAFASLSIPDSPSLNAMSHAGVAGMLLSFASVLLVTPLLMWVLGAPKAGTRAPRLFEMVVPLAQTVSKMPRAIPVLTVLVVAGLWLAQSQSQIGFRYADYLPRGADVSVALAHMEAAGLGSDRMIVIVEGDPDAPLARVRTAVDAIWGAGRSAWTEGPSGEAMLSRMAAQDGSAHALPVQLPIAAQDIRADTALNQLRADLAAADLAQATRIIGPGYALLTEGPPLVQSMRMGLYGTIAVITAMVALVYRSWRLALVGFVINLIPILGIEAFLVLIGRELTIMNVIALTIAFGIAVDDTLHFLNRFALAPDGPIGDRVGRALAEAGPPMVATTIILLAGMLLTLTSALPGMAVYGGLIALAIVLALVSDLFLLPGLIRWSLR